MMAFQSSGGTSSSGRPLAEYAAGIVDQHMHLPRLGACLRLAHEAKMASRSVTSTWRAVQRPPASAAMRTVFLHLVAQQIARTH